MKWLEYARLLWARSCRNAWRVVIGRTWRQLVIKGLSVAALLVFAFLYTSSILAEGATFFSDQLTIALLTVVAAATIVLVVFAFQLLVVAPYELWRETQALVPELPDYLLIEDAGRWLYENGSESFRTYVKGHVPALWPTIAKCCRSYIIEAAKEAGYPLFARWEDGLPWERIDPVESEFSAFEALFGTDGRKPADLAVRRADLGIIRAYYADG